MVLLGSHHQKWVKAAHGMVRSPAWLARDLSSLLDIGSTYLVAARRVYGSPYGAGLLVKLAVPKLTAKLSSYGTLHWHRLVAAST